MCVWIRGWCSAKLIGASSPGSHFHRGRRQCDVMERQISFSLSSHQHSARRWRISSAHYNFNTEWARALTHSAPRGDICALFCCFLRVYCVGAHTRWLFEQWRRAHAQTSRVNKKPQQWLSRGKWGGVLPGCCCCNIHTRLVSFAPRNKSFVSVAAFISIYGTTSIIKYNNIASWLKGEP